jgi:hypothetical protein
MKLTRQSPFTGSVNTMEIPMTTEEFETALSAWKNGALIQNAFPTLNADQREFVKTGIPPAEWDTFVKDE